MGREMGERFKGEETYVYLWLIHVDVWQKPTKFCKSIILQLKTKIFFFKLSKVAQGHTATGWTRIQTHPQERSVMKHKTRTQQM